MDAPDPLQVGTMASLETTGSPIPTLGQVDPQDPSLHVAKPIQEMTWEELAKAEAVVNRAQEPLPPMQFSENRVRAACPHPRDPDSWALLAWFPPDEKHEDGRGAQVGQCYAEYEVELWLKHGLLLPVLEAIRRAPTAQILDKIVARWVGKSNCSASTLRKWKAAANRARLKLSQK